MSLKDVLDNTQFVGYSPAEVTQLKAILTDVYTNSAEGRAMLEQGISGPGIQITNVPNVAQAYAGTGRVELDLSYVNNLSAIDDTGTAFAFDNTYVLTHELVHAITGKRDLTGADRPNGKHYTGFRNYEGETEEMTKDILEEMGITQYRASYDSAGRRANHPIGTEYTNNETIDNAVVSFQGPVYTDHRFDNDRDLVIDDSGRGQTLRTGGGRDFVYGRAGNDTIDTGTGNDEAYGGAGDDRIIVGAGSDLVDGGAGFDRADYSSILSGPKIPFTPNTGITVEINGADVSVTKRDFGVLRSAEIDTLRDIENITGTSRDDVFNVENVSGNMYIDGAAGLDKLQVSGTVANSFVLDPTDGTYPAGHPLAGQTYNGKISDGTNTIYYSNIDDANVTGFVGVEPDNFAPVNERVPPSEMSIEDAATTLMRDIPIVQAALDAKETNGTMSEEEASLARILDTPMAPTLLRSLQEGGVGTLDLTGRNMDTAIERVESLLQSSREAFEAHDLAIPELTTSKETPDDQKEQTVRSESQSNTTHREDENESTYVMG